jgi:hypothetical protein
MIGILSIYYKLPYPFPNFKKLDAELIQKYSGTFASIDIPLKITVFEKEGNLLAQATGQPSFPLTFSKDDVFVFVPAGIEMEFTSSTSFILKQGGQKFNFTKE